MKKLTMDNNIKEIKSLDEVSIDWYEKFRCALRGYRIVHKLKQKQIAEDLGISLPFYSDIERGNAKPNAITFIKMCKYCGYSV